MFHAATTQLDITMRKVERIGCLNNGIFIMNFSIQWFDSKGSWHTSAWNSGNFNNGLYKVSPALSSLGVPADAIGVAPYVCAVLGTSSRGTPLVQSADNGRLAAYEVTGTTLDFKVQPLPWRNWAQNIVHTMSIDGEYYFSPTNLVELRPSSVKPYWLARLSAFPASGTRSRPWWPKTIASRRTRRAG